VFTREADREVYLSLLRESAERRRLHVLAYCLMTNHVHLVVVPDTADALSSAMRDIQMTYAAYLHRREGASGHLWQGRFHACVLDEPHLWAAIRYVERNPVRAGLVPRAEDYWWSSAAAHCGMRADCNLPALALPPNLVTDWRTWLCDEDAALTQSIRQQTRTGRPCGSDAFVKQLESILGRPLAPRPSGD
jgi:putative transposase